MRMAFIAVACVFLLGGAGCVIIPLRNKVTGGHRYSTDTVAFLKLPGTTRAEVVASLGPPSHESQETRTVLYSWEVTPRFYVVPEPQIICGELRLTSEFMETSPEQMALFIAYDEREMVVRHEIRKVRARTLQEACAEWGKGAHR